MGMSIEDIKHCLNVMVDCEVCEECNLYGTTGTDHCEHDCVYGALDIIDKYQKIQKTYERFQQDDDYHPVMAWLDVMAVIGDGDAE
jgi:hypothetical protein